MLAKELFLSDAAYSAWSNQRLLDACSGIADLLLTRDLGASHSCILTTLQHICDAERVWLDCLTTTPDMGAWRLPDEEAPRLSLEELKSCWPGLGSDYQRWLGGVSDRAFAVKLTVHLPNGTSPKISRSNILRHVLDHSTFHRGQVIGMIRALGRTPPAINRMDFVLAA